LWIAIALVACKGEFTPLPAASPLAKGGFCYLLIVQIAMNKVVEARTLDQRIENLKQRLIGFVVLNSNGNPLGTVLNVRTDEQRHLNLVVLPLNNASPEFLIRTKSIMQIDLAKREISVTAAELEDLPEYAMSSENITPKAIAEDVDPSTVIRLLEERLAVDYQRKKVGEVTVRKEIETHYIQVPVRREKLIVEQVSPERKPLFEVDLTQGEIEGLEITTDSESLQGTFSSPRTVAWLMDAIAHQGQHGCKRIRVEIELDDPTHAALYRQWFDKCKALD
jgi:Domain of unknown function (DUF2382)